MEHPDEEGRHRRLGSSKQDFSFETDFLGQRFQVQRLGADDDIGKAWELMRRQQASADAIGLGEVGDHYRVGQDTVINKETHRLLNVVTRVPATTGATLRRLLQVRAVRHVQNELGTTSTTTWCCSCPACATTTWRWRCRTTRPT
jgi:hypothetical protein